MLTNEVANEVAIVGIDSQFGEHSDIDRVARALYVGAGVTTGKNFKAELISSVVNESIMRMLDALSFSELVNQNNSAVTSEIDVIIIVDNSVVENAIESNEKASNVVNTLSAQAHINNIHVVSQLSEALTLAVTLLDEDRLVALIGVNTASKQTDDQSPGTKLNNSISFCSHFSEYQIASGFASILLAPKLLAVNAQLPIYGQLTAMATSTVEANAMKAAVLKSLEQINEQAVSLVEVSALGDKFHSELESSVLLDAYNEVSHVEQTLTRAISCARSITGEGGGFSQVLGLLRTVIALQQRYIPGINNWNTPVEKSLLKWQASSFYFPTESRTRYPNADGSKHSAAYSCLTEDSYCHLVLTEHILETSLVTNSATNSATIQASINESPNESSTKRTALIRTNSSDSTEQDIRFNGFLASSDLHLVLVNGDDEAELQQNLLTLSQFKQAQRTLAQSPLAQSTPAQSTPPLYNVGKKNADKMADLKTMADQQYQHFLSTPDKKYTISLLAESSDELIKEVELAKQGIKNVFLNLEQPELGRPTQWKTPKGSYFSSDPAAINKNTQTSSDNVTSEKVCFMYPGIGATYVGLGRDLFQLFPEIYPDVADLADDIGSSLKDTLLNPRSITRLDFKTLKQRDLALRGNLADIAEAGVGFACVFTKIFTKVFKLNADFATGYSMGEVSMYAALGCWQQPGLMSARLANSSTFNERLCGDLLTLREHWQLPLLSKNSISNTDKAQTPIWETYTIKSTLAQVEAACIGEPRVYCTIINTPDSVLIGGYPADCLRVIAKLGVRAMPLNMANAIHSAPAKAEYDDMVALYTMAVNTRINTKLYSSSCYLPVPQLSKAIANSIAKCLCDRVDFPRLVNTLYNKGARIFIEMGPGRSLCSWVDKTLEHEQEQQSKEHEHKHKHEHEHKKIKNSFNENTVSVPVNAKGVSDELTYFRAIAKLVSHGVKLDLNSLFYGSIIIRRKS